MTGLLVTWFWPIPVAAAIALVYSSRAGARLVTASPLLGLAAAVVVEALQIRHAPDAICFQGATGCTLLDSAAGYHVFFLGVTYAIGIQAGALLGALHHRRSHPAPPSSKEETT